MYETHFCCPIKFKATQNALIFNKSDMDLPFVTYNADLLATVAPQLEAELAQELAQKTFSEHAKGILKQLLAGQRPGIQDLARELHLSTRTLQRRLTEQGITFQQLLDEARREPARHYLLHSSRELNETAYLGLRGRKFLLPRLPSLGRNLTRTMATAPKELRLGEAGAAGRRVKSGIRRPL
jgi:AraC-like DNA-binding protein